MKPKSIKHNEKFIGDRQITKKQILRFNSAKENLCSSKNHLPKKKCYYLLDLPKDYAEKTDWPILVFLHGYGQSGDDLQIVRENGPPKLVVEGKQFPFVLA